jgi:hypothetical protein
MRITARLNGGATYSTDTPAGGGDGGTSPQVHWLVREQLGTPRMVFDQSGSLATVSDIGKRDLRVPAVGWWG